MGKRRKGREIVLQSCYASRVSGTSLTTCLADQITRRRAAEEAATFAENLAAKMTTHQDEMDSWLGILVQNWSPERLGLVVRVILLMALTELRHCPEVPWRVVINEACELARRFGDEEAVAFVNGVLDRAAAEVRANDDDGGAKLEPPDGEGAG